MKDVYEIKFINGEKKLFINGEISNPYILLSNAIDEKDDNVSREYLHLANNFRDDNIYNNLYFATLSTVTDRIMSKRIGEFTEFDVHELFKKRYPLISGAEIINVQSNKQDIPDVWVLENGLKIPVEIKKGRFNKSALRQLKRYINAYNCSFGIAVGEEVTVDLPGNIKFVSIDQLKNDKE